jgi:hypothetical protein
LRPLIGGQKVKKLAEIFMVDARILYVIVVALVVFLWLIFKLDFHLDDDLNSLN